MVRLSNAVKDNIEQEDNTVTTHKENDHNQDWTEEESENTPRSAINSISAIGNNRHNSSRYSI